MTQSTSLTAPARDLRASMRGRVLVAADPAYDGARRIWNGAVDRLPALIARCEDDQDVAAAVRIAREHGLPLSVRGGGHDWAGRSLVDGGVVIDLTAMRRVTIDPLVGAADAQGGVTAGGLAAAAHDHGFAPVTGTVKAVGMAGLTLGGGYGLLNGRHGLALDNMISAKVVLADGTRVTASAAENPDLYWGLRGGGGNFGVVTNVRYRLHAIRQVVSGMVLFPLSEAAAVLRGYQELISDAPDELTVMTGFFTGPDGAPLLFLLPAWSGDQTQAEQVVARLEHLGEPLSAQIGPMAFQDMLGMFDGVVVDGRHTEMRNRWLPGLTEDGIAALIDGVSRITSPFSGIYVHHFHGAASRVRPADTAFALRRDHLLVEIAAMWSADEDGGAHEQWARDLSESLAPYALPGGYPNLLGTDEPERVRLAFGANTRRLLDVKRHYDPEHVFSAVPTLA